MEDIMQIILLCVKFGCQWTSLYFACVLDIEHIIVCFKDILWKWIEIMKRRSWIFIHRKAFILCNSFSFLIYIVTTPLWGKCEDETHTPKSENFESSGTPAISEINCKGQNTSPWSVLYTVGKALKCRCWKCPRMSHSNICNTSYGRKKGRESNWQFDSRPLKVGNRPDPSVCRWSAKHRWKALKEN